MDADCNKKEKWADDERAKPCYCNEGGCAQCEGLVEPDPEPDDLDPYSREEVGQ